MSGVTLAADALLGLLHPFWQALIAFCLLAVTLIGVQRLLSRGPARMTNALVVVGFLIVAITVLGALAVSCSEPTTTAEDPGDTPHLAALLAA